MIPLVLLLLSADPPSAKFYLRAVEGKQCQLRAAKEVAKEKERLGAKALDVWVAYDLAPALLPPPCVPKKPFGPPPKAVCQACGCPQTWYFCAQSTNDLKPLGYTALE